MQIDRAHGVELEETRKRVLELGGRARDDRAIRQLVTDMDPQDARVRRLLDRPGRGSFHGTGSVSFPPDALPRTRTRDHVDGIPVWCTDVPGPCMGGLIFRTGRVDETLVNGGINHIVEHLALFPFEPRRYDLNGTRHRAHDQLLRERHAR